MKRWRVWVGDKKFALENNYGPTITSAGALVFFRDASSYGPDQILGAWGPGSWDMVESLKDVSEEK